jgi:hypothetical protein
MRDENMANWCGGRLALARWQRCSPHEREIEVARLMATACSNKGSGHLVRRKPARIRKPFRDYD